MGYIEDRWLAKKKDPITGQRTRTEYWGSNTKRYKVCGIPGVRARSFERLEDAKVWKAKTETEVRQQEFIDPRRGSMRLDEYARTHFLPHLVGEPGTRRLKRLNLETHIIPILGARPLRQVDAAALREFNFEAAKRVGPATAAQLWQHLYVLLQAAVQDERLARNPCVVHKSLRPKPPEDSKAEAWPQESADAIRENMAPRYRLALDLGVGLGLRQGEALGIGAHDFGVNAGGQNVVNVRRQLQWDGGKPYFKLPKGNRTREVPIPPRLSASIKRCISQFPPVEVTLPWADPAPPTTEAESRQRKPATVPLLITTRQRQRVYYKRFNDQVWKPALHAVGLIEQTGIRRYANKRYRSGFSELPVFDAPRHLMFHSLRHTFASVQLHAGESVVSVSQWMGHKNITITYERYAHFMPGAGTAGLAAMDLWFPEAEVEADLPQDSLGDEE